MQLIIPTVGSLSGVRHVLFVFPLQTGCWRVAMAEVCMLLCRVFGSDVMTLDEYLQRRRSGLEVPDISFETFAVKLLTVRFAAILCPL